jgi:hypothetical protein
LSLFSNHEGYGGGIARKSICDRKDVQVRITNEPVVGFLEGINFLVMLDSFFIIIKIIHMRVTVIDGYFSDLMSHGCCLVSVGHFSTMNTFYAQLGKVDVLKSIKDRVVWHTKTAVEDMQLFSPPKRVGVEWMHTHSQKK